MKSIFFAVIATAIIFGASATRLFPNNSEWFQDVTNAALDAESDEIIQWLVDAGGWG
jgi:hypothetical protein